MTSIISETNSKIFHHAQCLLIHFHFLVHMEEEINVHDNDNVEVDDWDPLPPKKENSILHKLKVKFTSKKLENILILNLLLLKTKKSKYKGA